MLDEDQLNTFMDLSAQDASEEAIYEIHENHKYEIPKLVFFEDHVKDKDKRI